jgi:prephenate dehydrogenase
MIDRVEDPTEEYPLINRPSVSGLTVAIVGIGQMGASFAGALRGKCQSVIGIDNSSEVIEIALKHKLIDHGTTDLIHGVYEANVVILATPVRVILSLLDQLAPYLANDCLLMDLGSTKSQIVIKMAALPNHLQPIGGHPMCGREISGVLAADPEIYKNAVFILTPLSNTSKRTISLSLSLIDAIGSHPLILDPERHDRLVAAISHLPYLLACALVNTVQEVASADSLVWDVASSGFRDTSRLAASDITMMLDIVLTNRKASIEALRRFDASFNELIKLVVAGDEGELRKLLTEVYHRRSNLFKNNNSKVSV